jgi:hypothetical protein
MRSDDGFWTYPIAMARLWVFDGMTRQRRSRSARSRGSGRRTSRLAWAGRGGPRPGRVK